MKFNLVGANDNRPRIDAEFLHMPEMFLQVYSKELLGWAGDIQTSGPFLEIDLWSPPGSGVLSPGYQGKVKFRCDALADEAEKSLLMVIQPDGEEMVARVRQHIEALPSIMAAHRAVAEANKGKARGAVSAVFEKIPDYFVERYGLELRAWGQNLKKIGLVKTIVLREGMLSDLSPEAEQGAVLLGVKLKAEIERLKMDQLRLVISPATENDERIIAKHCEKMQKAGIKPRASLVEPPRPGLPFMPDIVGATPNADGGI